MTVCLPFVYIMHLWANGTTSMSPDRQTVHALGSGEKTVPRQGWEHHSSVYPPGCLLHQHRTLLPGLMSHPETLQLGALSVMPVGSCHIDLPVTCMCFWNAPKLTFPSKLAFSQSQSAMLTKFEGSFQTSLHEGIKPILPFSSFFFSSPPSHHSVMLPRTLVLDPSSFPAPRV